MIQFLSVFPPYRGGISKFSDYLFRSHRRLSSGQPTLKAINFKKLYPSLLFPGESQLDPNPDRVYDHYLLHSYNPVNWWTSANRLSGMNPSLLVYSYWHPFLVPLYRQIIKRIKRKHPSLPVLGIAHNVLPHESFPFMRPLVRSLFRSTDRVVLISSQTESQYNSLQLDTPYERLFHPVYEQPRPQASKEELRQRYGIDRDKNVLLYFGLIRPYKGVDLLIKALNRIDFDRWNIHPMIVGEFYMDKEKILHHINAGDSERYTIMDRFVSDREMAEIMTLTDLLVLPYRSASQSGVLMNAINFQLPSLIPDLPGLTEYIEPDRSGLVFERNNIESLQDQIVRFIQDDMGASIQEELSGVKQSLSWSNFTKKFIEIEQSIREKKKNK